MSDGRNSVPMNNTSRQCSARSQPEEAPRLSDRDPVMRVALDHLGIGPAPDGEHHRPAASPCHGFGDRAGKAAAAADDRDDRPVVRALHAPSSCPQDASSPCSSRRPRSAGCIKRPLAAGADERNDFFDQRIIGEFARRPRQLDRRTRRRPGTARDRRDAADAARPAWRRAAASRRRSVRPDLRSGRAHSRTE